MTKISKTGRNCQSTRRSQKILSSRISTSTSSREGNTNNSKLICGDCIDEIRLISDESVDAVVTDPPYGIGYRTRSGKKVVNDERPFIWWLRDAWRVTREGGVLLCFCRWDVQEDFRWAIELAGWKVKSQVVWDRVLHGMGDVRAAFAPSHDVIWFAVKGSYQFPGTRPRSIIHAKRVHSGLVHPTEKPVALMEQLLESVVPSNGTVLDPCMGSGTTGVACNNLKLNFIGIEIDETHFETAMSRLNH